MPPDGELLRRYADQRDEEAFAELVRRHVGLVYGAALRQVGGDPHRAQEVAQAVFCDLARKAGALAGRDVLASWLHTSTRFAAGKLWRTEIRRWKNEREAGAMKAAVPDNDEAIDWEQLRPVIDEVVQNLSERDREAVLQRFFANRAYGDIAANLGVSEDAARMRVERALEKLRALLANRGLTSTSVALATVLGGQAAAAAPAGLAATLTTGALAAGAATGGGTAVVAAKLFIHMSTTKVMIGVAGMAIVAAGLVVFRQQQTTEALRAEVMALKSEKGGVAALRVENERLIAEKRAVEDTAKADHEELVKLQAARDAFRKQLAVRGAAAAPAGKGAPGSEGASIPPGMISVDVMKDVGNNTPNATAETLVWAMQNGEVKRAASLLTFGKGEREKLDGFIQTLPDNIREQYKTPEELIAFTLSGSPKPLGAVQLLGTDETGPNEVVHHVQVQFQSGDFRRDDIHFQREADGTWKQVVSPATVDRVITYFQGKK